MRTAARMQRLGTEAALSLGARVRELMADGRDIIPLHIGEPDFDTPAHVVEAAHRAMTDGHTHYAPPLGVPAFREVIAADAVERLGVRVEPHRVVVTPGAKPVLTFALNALVDPGDEVIVPDPGFPIYASMVRFLGGIPVPVTLRPELSYRLDLDELRSLVSSRTRMIVINSPGNPTGGILTRGDLEGVASVALAHDLIVLTDEIYSRLVHEGEHHSMLQVEGMAEHTIVLDGLSKTYAMTGWRLGWGIVPAALVEPFERQIINSVTSTATYAQIAGVAALTGPQEPVRQMLAELGARRRLMVESLAALPGVEVVASPGAFYVFPDVSGTGLDGATFARRLLEEAGVSTVAGTDFGDVALGNVRISYASSQANLAVALDRLAAFLETERTASR
ncbi:MAG: pyridoxal phosphate-dependent aminotransferase [Candidatus Limnocylindrales bacterium]